MPGCYWFHLEYRDTEVWAAPTGDMGTVRFYRTEAGARRQAEKKKAPWVQQLTIAYGDKLPT